jgi:GMP synthase (glutamine-hydrolysing)
LRVVAVVFQDDAGPGVFGETVRSSGFELVEWRPQLGEPEPTGFDAVMVFGGAMHPHQVDEHPWLDSQRDWLRGLIERDVPALGVCLGAELLGEAAGGSVVKLASPEIGWEEARLTDGASSDPVFGALPASFPSLQWHSYALEPPAGALARTSASAQAYRLADRAWGIQFHAEVTLAMLDAWTEEDPEELPMPASELRAESKRVIGRSNAQGRWLADAFLREAEASV